MEVKADHLAKPGRLTPSANTYIVWFQQEGSQPQSQGELKIGDNHKGELKSTTTFNNFKVIITAETDSQTKHSLRTSGSASDSAGVERGRLS